MIQNLNLNSLIVFNAVVEHKSMTKAAHALGMTQPGVSQHIQHLEESVGKKLFERERKSIYLTHIGAEFYKISSRNLKELDRGLYEILGEKKEHEGLITIGLPIEFGNSVVLPKLAELSKIHPGISYKFIYGYAIEMGNLLLERKIDIAFVDSFNLDKRIRVKKVFEEELYLCATDEFFERMGGSKKYNKKYFEGLNYVAYLEGEPVLRDWFKRRFGYTHMSLNVASYSMDVQGVATMISQGLGAGVLPEYALDYLGEEGRKLRDKTKEGRSVKNTISIAHFGRKIDSPLAKFVHDYLLEQFS